MFPLLHDVGVKSTATGAELPAIGPLPPDEDVVWYDAMACWCWCWCCCCMADEDIGGGGGIVDEIDAG